MMEAKTTKIEANIEAHEANLAFIQDDLGPVVVKLHMMMIMKATAALAMLTMNV